MEYQGFFYAYYFPVIRPKDFIKIKLLIIKLVIKVADG